MKRLAAMLFVCMVGTAAARDIYLRRDANGVLHLSNAPATMAETPPYHPPLPDAWWLSCVAGTGFGPFNTASECTDMNTQVEWRCQHDQFRHETKKSLERWKAICARLRTDDCQCVSYWAAQVVPGPLIIRSPPK
jgi:hypothetical protein